MCRSEGDFKHLKPDASSIQQTLKMAFGSADSARPRRKPETENLFQFGSANFYSVKSARNCDQCMACNTQGLGTLMSRPGRSLRQHHLPTCAAVPARPLAQLMPSANTTAMISGSRQSGGRTVLSGQTMKFGDDRLTAPCS